MFRSGEPCRALVSRTALSRLVWPVCGPICPNLRDLSITLHSLCHEALVWLLSSGLYPILHTHPPFTLPSTPSLDLFTNVVLFACVLHRHRCAGLSMDGYLIPMEQNVIGIDMSNNSLKVITPAIPFRLICHSWHHHPPNLRLGSIT